MIIFIYYLVVNIMGFECCYHNDSFIFLELVIQIWCKKYHNHNKYQKRIDNNRKNAVILQLHMKIDSFIGRSVLIPFVKIEFKNTVQFAKYFLLIFIYYSDTNIYFMHDQFSKMKYFMQY